MQEQKQTLRQNKHYETELSILTKNKDDELYQIRLQYEERGRKQMESYARELGIKYAHSDSDETIQRLKQSGEGLIKEKKDLENQVKDLQQKLQQSSKNQGSSANEGDLKIQIKALNSKVSELNAENITLRKDLESSISTDLVTKLDMYRKREGDLDQQVRELKREIEKLKIKYE